MNIDMDKITNKNIRKWLKEHIEKEDIKQSRYARLCGVSRAEISLFLQGERTLAKQDLLTIYKDISRGKSLIKESFTSI